MNEPTPVVTPTEPTEGESLETPEEVKTTGSLFEKEQGSNAPHQDVPFKMDNGQLIKGTIIIILITLFFLALAFIFFRPLLEGAASFFTVL